MSDEIVIRTEQNVLDLIERAAKDSSIDVAKMNALLDLQLRVMDKQAEVSFNRDFAAASKEMPKITKKGVIDMREKGKMTYAKYEDLHAAIKPIEDKYGFTRSFSTHPNPAGVEMVLTMSHRDGHSKTSSRLMPPDTGAGRNAMQAIGSASSYAKRYLTMDFWDIITVGADDDGIKSGAITDAQIREIEELIVDTETNKEKFLSHLHVSRIGDIQQYRYSEAISLLRQKKAMNEQKKR